MWSAADCVILTTEGSAPALLAWSLCRRSTVCLLRAALSPYACHCRKQTSPLRRISASPDHPRSPSSICSHVYFKIDVSTILKSALYLALKHTQYFIVLCEVSSASAVDAQPFSVT